VEGDPLGTRFNNLRLVCNFIGSTRDQNIICSVLFWLMWRGSVQNRLSEPISLVLPLNLPSLPSTFEVFPKCPRLFAATSHSDPLQRLQYDIVHWCLRFFQSVPDYLLPLHTATLLLTSHSDPTATSHSDHSCHFTPRTLSHKKFGCHLWFRDKRDGQGWRILCPTIFFCVRQYHIFFYILYW